MSGGKWLGGVVDSGQPAGSAAGTHAQRCSRGYSCSCRLEGRWRPQGAQTGGGMAAYEGIRSIFFYNSDVELGQEIGLHLFEPRYRVMIKRAMTEPSRCKQIIFLPNFRDYIPSHGDVGFAATITRYRPIRSTDMKPGELPRAEIQMRFESRVLVLFHWVEPSTHGLHECSFVRISDVAPPDDRLHNLRQTLSASVDSRYVVNTRQFLSSTQQSVMLPVHSEPGNPFDQGTVVGHIEDGESVVALEHDGRGWIRHATGWSVTRHEERITLVPANASRMCQFSLLHPGVTLFEGSTNCRPPSNILVHGQSEKLLAEAATALDQLVPGSGEHVLRVLVADQALTTVASLIERLVAVVSDSLAVLRGR